MGPSGNPEGQSEQADASRAVRGDIPKGSAETFFRKVKFWKGDAPPIFVSSQSQGLFAAVCEPGFREIIMSSLSRMSTV